MINQTTKVTLKNPRALEVLHNVAHTAKEWAGREWFTLSDLHCHLANMSHGIDENTVADYLTLLEAFNFVAKEWTNKPNVTPRYTFMYVNNPIKTREQKDAMIAKILAKFGNKRVIRLVKLVPVARVASVPSYDEYEHIPDISDETYSGWDYTDEERYNMMTWALFA